MTRLALALLMLLAVGCDTDPEFEIQKAINLDTGELLSESEFYKRVGEDGRITIEGMMVDAEQDDYADYCDRRYDEWRDRQMED